MRLPRSHTENFGVAGPQSLRGAPESAAAMADELADVLENRVMLEILANRESNRDRFPRSYPEGVFSLSRTVIMPAGFVLLLRADEWRWTLKVCCEAGLAAARRYLREDLPPELEILSSNAPGECVGDPNTNLEEWEHLFGPCVPLCVRPRPPHRVSRWPYRPYLPGVPQWVECTNRPIVGCTGECEKL